MMQDIETPPIDAAGGILLHAETEPELLACYPVMKQLRPSLADAAEFIASVTRMKPQGYRLLAVWEGERAVALAGYRLKENLVHGKFLYVDDLVTLDSARGKRWGAQLLSALSDMADKASCTKLVLDTAASNALAQRFYFREGLLLTGMHFAKALR
ncbi:GNAT family N-acetyltransferase [Undibacterium terreum]|uniref:N-acetyltransferase GCN5 n=1 Tax=Undibacterium terreum TaxID=1224302 RepID=A0A916UUF5_9BURK|nr:GNAT family N-acetyltransferase [Undibacterium terreum]GGC89038.1 N-acetyltransferase GCN5 [Undibacterium terreum]